MKSNHSSSKKQNIQTLNENLASDEAALGHLKFAWLNSADQEASTPLDQLSSFVLFAAGALLMLCIIH